MKLVTKLSVIVALLAFGAVPALALPAQAPTHAGAGQAPTTTTPPSNQGTAHRPSTPGPNASLPSKARAYGKYCQTESKRHVAGVSGTPFSKCVTAMARLARGTTTSPREACKTESKKRLPGQHGTPFSKCVSGGARLLRDQRAQD